MRKNGSSNNDIRDTAIGFASGSAVAVGGAIKDAPYEGFDTIRFIRSPVIGAVVGLVTGRLLTNNPLLIFLIVIAIERIITESYKLGRGNMPGKFGYGEWGKPKCCKCPQSRDEY